MATAERFEDLKVWRSGRSIAAKVYSLTERPPFSRDFALRDQLRRSAVSIPSNIAEGFSRRSRKEFIQYLFVAKGSAAEAQSQLYTALDLAYVSQEAFDEVFAEIDALAKQISRLITYLKGAE